MAFLDTPRSDAFHMTGIGELALGDISPAKSFHSSERRGGDLLSHMRSNRGNLLCTPSARNILGPRQDQAQSNGGADEISLLLKSSRRTSLGLGMGKESLRGPVTPAFVRNGQLGGNSPALDPGESCLMGSEVGSFLAAHTPVPEMPNSSAQTTPLAPLPAQRNGTIMSDQHNAMTLREQENVSDGQSES